MTRRKEYLARVAEVEALCDYLLSEWICGNITMEQRNKAQRVLWEWADEPLNG